MDMHESCSKNIKDTVIRITNSLCARNDLSNDTERDPAPQNSFPNARIKNK